jgi:hypothetical protein
MLLLSSLYCSSLTKNFHLPPVTMKFSFQAATAVILALAGNAGAVRTASEGIRRLSGNSDGVTFPQAGACIDLPSGNVGDGLDGWSLALDPAHNDDGYSSHNLGFPFSFYGVEYGIDGVYYINNNGNLSFESPHRFPNGGFPRGDIPIIAPFWADVDTGDSGAQLGHAWVKNFPARNVMAVTYENVGYYDEKGDKLNSFQMLISDGNDEAMGLGNNICFCYQHMDWTTGSASDGVDGFGGVPATVGANKGSGGEFFQIGRFNRAGSEYLGTSGISGVDYLDNKSFCFDAVRKSHLLPLAFLEVA